MHTIHQPKRQRPSTNSKTQLEPLSQAIGCPENDNGQAKKGKNEYIIEMVKNYPFNQPCPENCLKLAKYTRNFRSAEYPELKRQVQANLQLKHPNLVNIVRAFQSKKNGYFQLYYEYIPESIDIALMSMQKQQVIQAQNRLSDLCKYLIINNIIPEISTCNIGIKDNTLKYYLDIQKISSKNLSDKREISAMKEIQIKTFFLKLLHKSNQQIVKLTRNASTGLQMSPIVFGYHTVDQENRISSLENKKQPQLTPDKNDLDLNKIRQIDDKINQLKLRMSRRPKAYRQSTGTGLADRSAYKKKPSHSPSTPNKDIINIVHQYMQVHHYDLKEGRDRIVQQPPIEITVGHDDEESVDTYNQELGDEPELPKIVHNQMRQTTKPVTKSSQQFTFKDKLHESVGYNQVNMTKKLFLAKDNNSINGPGATPNLRSRHVSYQQNPKSATSSNYIYRKDYQKSQINKSPQISTKKSAAASKGSNQSRKRMTQQVLQIKNAQKEISFRKLSENKEQSKRPAAGRKMTQPKGRGLSDQKLQGIMKYYSFEPELLDQFNDIFQSQAPNKNTESHIRTQCGNDSHINTEIKQRVKLALKKSEATLESIRQKKGRKFEINASGSYF